MAEEKPGQPSELPNNTALKTPPPSSTEPPMKELQSEVHPVQLAVDGTARQQPAPRIVPEHLPSEIDQTGNAPPIDMGQTPGSSNQPLPVQPPAETQPPPGFPWPLLLVIAIFAVIGVVIGYLAGTVPVKRQLEELTRHLQEPAVAALPYVYTDDLYGFALFYPVKNGVMLSRREATSGCDGVMFTTAANSLGSDPSVYPRLQICFLGFDTGIPPNDLHGQLEARTDRVVRELLDDARPGLVRNTQLGQGRATAEETYLRGKDSESVQDKGKEAKWYLAVAEYNDRFYAIEAADLASDWDVSWPAFRNAINSLKFDSDIEMPPNAPLVIP